MSKIMNVNSSLAYEILLYLNSFYLGMFIVCEVAIGILKACNVSYPESAIVTEAGIFGLLCLVEVIRIFLGRKGNLVNRKIPVFFSILLTVPSAIGVCYFLIYQTYILRLEYIWCAVMLIFQALELAFAILFIVTVYHSVVTIERVGRHGAAWDGLIMVIKPVEGIIRVYEEQLDTRRCLCAVWNFLIRKKQTTTTFS